jgi:formamidopyrimidine-DNA glycosylase
MPELPEVETIRSAVARLVSGKEIRKVRVMGRRVVEESCRQRIRETLIGKRFSACLRRGKYLVLQGEDFSLLVHFGMSGELTFFPRGAPINQHTHLVIGFADRSELHFQDPRTFGRIKLYFSLSPQEIPELCRLGWDPLEERLSLSRLRQALRRRKAHIKAALLDQRLIAGIGNIYASEILFRASINPLKSANQLSEKELGRLHRAIHEVLRGAIRRGGTSIISFRNAEGRRGRYQDLLQVYGREDEACPRCQTPILNRLLSGRSTYYCPRCQGSKGGQ